MSLNKVWSVASSRCLQWHSGNCTRGHISTRNTRCPVFVAVGRDVFAAAAMAFEQFSQLALEVQWCTGVIFRYIKFAPQAKKKFICNRVVKEIHCNGVPVYVYNYEFRQNF